jgi:hypothetical protein
MGKFVWANVRLFAGTADLTGVTNKLEVKAEREAKESTAFAASGDVWKEVLAGIASTQISGEGQWEAGDSGKVDDESMTDLASVIPVTVGPVGAADGDLAYLTGALRTSFQVGGAVGDVAPWSGDLVGNWPLVRGKIAHPPGTARSSTGTGTAYQLGAVSSTQQLYAALHVLSLSGTSPSITVKVQSDNASNFPSAADQLTFTAATARSGQLLRVAGPITDDWFRVSYTISGTGPSILFAVSFGVA